MNSMETMNVSLSRSEKLTRKRKRVIRDTCFIDILPDDILTIILSFLTPKEAWRTRILSRRWRYLWSFNLVFELVNQSPKFTDEVEVTEVPKFTDEVEVTEFTTLVNQVVALHQGPAVDKLIIRLSGTQLPRKSRYDSHRRNHRGSLINLICDWMCFAMRKKVKVFELVSFGYNKLPVFQMEKCSCQTRKVFLHYNFPDLDKFLSITRAIEPKGSLVSLTSFRLVNIHIKHGMIEYLLSNCPILEELCITGSECISNMNIVSSSLKSLSVCNCWNLENLEIYAANLLSLEYMGCLHNFPLLSVKLDQNAPLLSVRLLNANIKDEMMEYILFNCRHLEELCIKGARFLSNLNVTSASLKSLSICHCGLKNLKISAANLVSFEYSAVPYYPSYTEFCIQDAPLLSELIIDFSYMLSFISKKDFHGIYYNQLEKLVLNLSSQALGVMSISGDYDNFPRLRFLKQLELSIPIIPGESLLFCVFWAMACPFLSTFCIQLYEESSKLFICPKHENQRRDAKRKLKLNSYRHKHLKVVKLIDFIGHIYYMEFAMDLIQIAKSLQKLIVNPKKDDPDKKLFYSAKKIDRIKVGMIKDYTNHLEASLPAGAELVMMH